MAETKGNAAAPATTAATNPPANDKAARAERVKNETPFKAARPFVDAATGIHYNAGDPIRERTLRPEKDVDDRTEYLRGEGHIVGKDEPLTTTSPASLTSDGSTLERIEIHDGETVDQARERAGTNGRQAVRNVDGSFSNVPKVAPAGEPSKSPAQKDALNEAKDK